MMMKNSKIRNIFLRNKFVNKLVVSNYDSSLGDCSPRKTPLFSNASNLVRHNLMCLALNSTVVCAQKSN
jgi:hypothetical protein